MIFQDIFKTGFLQIKLKQDLSSIKKFCLNYSKQNKSRQRSNPTGYQSEDVRNKPQVKSLIKDINKYSKIYLTEVLSSNDTPHLNHMWFNINYYKDYNDTHSHPFNKLAGVFYVSCPKNCGQIVFKNPTQMDAYYRVEDQGKFTEYNSASWSVPPEENMLYIFPAWLYHKVEPNLSKQSRISFSFNVS
jgi:uncharacterized protein (TIGR02466 family)|tara:strand:+ start:696 stop:1259 length:564 start_codon:yes stop_codon:yes gene_type:complete